MSALVLITSEFDLPTVLEAEWLACLPLLRRMQISGWRDAGARRRSLLGSRLLAEGLRRLGHPAAALASLRYSPQSRPTLDVAVDFSLSHCDGRIVCALSTHGPIGIDVEGLAGVTASGFGLYLSAAERAWAGRSVRRFYSVWTRKEAVVKAAGTRGLRDVARVDTLPSEQRAAFEGRLWRTPTVPVGRGHVAHLALADEPCDVTFDHIGGPALSRDARVSVGAASVTRSCAVL